MDPSMKRTLSTWLPVAALGLGLTACGGESAANRPIQEQIALTSAASCEELEQAIEDRAVEQMRSTLHRQGQYYRGGRDFAEAPTEADAGNGSGSGGPDAYTTTNTQVAGVDEADFVKNDGTRIFTLSRNRLVTSRSWPVEELAVQGALEIEGFPNEMFLVDDTVTIFSGVYEDASHPSYSPDDRAQMCWFGWMMPTHTKVTTVDVSDLSKPTVVGEQYLPGRYHSSRRIGERIHVVLKDDVRHPEGVSYWLNGYDFNSEGDFKRALAKLADENERLIREQRLEDWLRKGRIRHPDGTSTEVGHACSDFHLPNAPTPLGLVTVATLNAEGPTEQVERTSIIGDANVIYASEESLYVTASHWWWSLEPGQQAATYVHKFDLSQPEGAPYRASGVLNGVLLNQFSLDEHKGFLRAATTTVRNSSDLWRTETANLVSVLEERVGRLVLKGRTDELAPTESIFSARFMGDRGFIVTFRQVDPLFTFDLSDPANPRVVGELKIPGFSTYLHPVGDHHLLGIGEDRDEEGNWNSRRLKVSLYDVSDLSKPVERFKYLYGNASGYSEASYDHKAFNYFAERNTLALPVTQWGWNWSEFQSGLLVLDVDVERGFTLRGALSFDDVYIQHGVAEWSYYYQPNVRRSVMADSFVYAISDAGIRVADVADLSTPVATAPFTTLWPTDGSL